ncbi:cysteine--tRNA ligase [Soehngenia longivitae]|uniref:Cysteine--tRNA ligase n=1 Tax=Soehngenia longivitae TaxID=2562294 RepID=A0A4Z0DAA4_9FIRM|nr:cysteine--tRNA ligase [Soehngenia longivitae]TFZ41793.1 cysteine--tRNA ligase [Soehngenia longivitae]
MELYNSLTRKKEEFIPLVEGKVTMYNCGPTVYNYIHVGNARPLVVFDTLRRYFIYKGLDVKMVINFTDIDDKIINKANEEGKDTKEIAQTYIDAFMEDATELNLYEYETIHPRATEYIDKMIEFIQGLIEKDAAYVVDGNVYFRINRAKDYGKLSKKNIDELLSGARIEINEDKENPLDFVLWKKEKQGEPSWDSPWGKGRPGWHIECSVMAKVLLGETIDIHSGGEDLQFPHHENEIAQSETLTEKPFARYWLHNAMLTVDNKKMSKSLGNFFTLRDIKKYYDLEVLRFFLLSAHYRSQINFSKEAMEQSKSALDRLYNAKKNLEYNIENISDTEDEKSDYLEIKEKVDSYKEKFIKSMEDDINTADAIASIFELVRYLNQNLNEIKSKEALLYAYKVFMELNKVLGILSKKEEILEEDILKLIEKRNYYRKNKDFAKADEIRDELKNKGIILEDTKDGVKWKRI